MGNGQGGGGFAPDMWQDRAACGMPEDYQEHGWHTVSGHHPNPQPPR